MLKLLTSDKAHSTSVLSSLNLATTWHCVCNGKEGIRLVQVWQKNKRILEDGTWGLAG